MNRNHLDRSRRRFLQDVALGGVTAVTALSSSGRAATFENLTGKTDRLAARLKQLRLSHPRLHFDVQGGKRLRERAAGTHRRYADLLLQWVAGNRTWSPPAGLPDSKLNEVVLEQAGAFVTNAALAFVLSEKAEHLELARRWTLAMCEVPRGELRNYGLGIYAAGLARAYDWLYREWTDSERGRIRDHLAGLVRELYLGSIPESGKTHWWADAHLHHDHWIPVGGYGEAALGLLGEVDEAGRWAARAKLDFDVCLSWLGDDGAWHEGVADWCYALAPLLWFYEAWQSVVGEDLHHVPWLRNTAAYRLYHRLPDEGYVYLNDSFRSGRYNTSGSASCHLLRRLASLFRDGHAQWLAGRDEAFDLKPAGTPKGVYLAPYEGSSYGGERTEYPHPASQCVAWNVLWYDPSVRAEPPGDLPRCRHFANEDIAILRSGWDGQAAVVSLSCGPLGGHRCARRMRGGQSRSAANFSHAHADYNALTLFARGRYFLIPPGYARRGSRFQNTVAVNGADFRVDPAIDVHLAVVVEQPDFCYAMGDATEAFLPVLRVRRYRRQLVLLDGCLIVYDDLRLADGATRPWNQFQWTLQSDPREHELSVKGSAAIWRTRPADGPKLTLDVLQPEAFAWERATLESQAGAGMLEALRIVRPEWYSDRMRVLAVLYWDDRPAQPTLLRNSKLLGVFWPDTHARPTVAFALAETREAEARGLLPQELRNRPLLLFNYSPDDPGRYLKVGADAGASDRKPANR